ncbi:MAG: substrate-binding domain-containing protein [Alphaproteobacteria bacterium]|jgi:excisionase family DNA binding protein
MAEHRYLTTREVADLLRIKERKVYELVSANAIPVCRVTGKLLFPREVVTAWVDASAEYSGDLQALRDLPPVVAGSHDPLLDWALRESRSGLATVYEGSLAGLEKLAHGKAQAAGLHVFEPENGGWNRVHLAHTPGLTSVVLIEWARRQQGLVVAADNPLGIASVADLAGRRVIPRQAAAGSQVLLQHLMEKDGVTNSVDLLDTPASNETDIAHAVASGKAHAGLAIESVARQFGLGFVPLARERFDLAIWRRAYFEPPIQSLLNFARTERFAERAIEMGGYDISGMGTVQFNGAR